MISIWWAKNISTLNWKIYIWFKYLFKYFILCLSWEMKIKKNIFGLFIHDWTVFLSFKQHPIHIQLLIKWYKVVLSTFTLDQVSSLQNMMNQDHYFQLNILKWSKRLLIIFRFFLQTLNHQSLQDQLTFR